MSYSKNWAKGSGSTSQIAYWSGTNEVAGQAGLRFASGVSEYIFLGDPATQERLVAVNLAAGSPPTAQLHLAAGKATATWAPLKFTSGTNLTNPEEGAVEFSGLHGTLTTGLTTGTTLVQVRNRIDRQDGWHYTNQTIDFIDETENPGYHNRLYFYNYTGASEDSVYFVPGRPVRWGASMGALYYGIITTVYANTRDNTAAGGAASSITLDAGASAVNDYYNEHVIIITGGLGVGQVRVITDYDGGSKVATVASAWSDRYWLRFTGACTVTNGANGLVTIDVTGGAPASAHYVTTQAEGGL